MLPIALRLLELLLPAVPDVELLPLLGALEELERLPAGPIVAFARMND